ncbi:MAG: ABC transporter substrate-binding protein [Cyclobacteriaceae bacterium]
MKKTKLLLCSTFLLAFLPALAQTDFEKEYQRGKQFYVDGQYNFAMQVLKPIMRKVPENKFAEYASYYYALSAYYAGEVPVAKYTFMQMKGSFAYWNKIDEVKLWLARIHLESEEYSQASNVINEIKDKALKEEANRQKSAFLAQLTDEATLLELFEANPEEKQIGESLANIIATKAVEDQDRELLETIVERFNLDAQKYRIDDALVTIKKDVYRIAVVLPFMFDRQSATSVSLASNFVFDLYKGILLGKDKLQQLGIKVEIHAYDTKRDSIATQKIIELEEMKSMDLIIGPLYPVPFRIVSRFSYENKINMINPLSNNSAVIANNPYSFLLQPTFETMAKEAANFMANKVSNKNVIIFYGNSERDSLMARHYAKQIIERGFSVVHYEQVDNNNGKRITEFLAKTQRKRSATSQATSTNEDEEVLTIAPDSIGHIFVAAERAAVVSSAMTAIVTRGDNTLLVSRNNILDNTIIGYEVLERINAQLIAPDFVDYEDYRYTEFRDRYQKKFKAAPGKNAIAGYETLVSMGRLLNRYGKYFQVQFKEGNTLKGEIFSGIIYNNKNDNQFVPMATFENGDFVILNPLK